MNTESSQIPSENTNQNTKSKIITFAYNGDEQNAKDVLQCELEINPELDILGLTDSRGYTRRYVSFPYANLN